VHLFGPQRYSGPAILAPRPDLVPQPADLFEAWASLPPTKRLCNIAESTVGEADGYAEPREPVKRSTSRQASAELAEDPVSQARRHIAEAKARIERQEALIARLSNKSQYVTLADEANKILST
jgi:hypothetical protein